MSNNSSETTTTLTVLRGLPASGKSEKAKLLVKAGKRKTKRVERDCLRAMLDFEEFNPKNEKVVTLVQDAIIHTLLDNGYNVISSDTNLNPKTVAHLRGIAEAHGSWLEVDANPMLTPVEECIKRDLERPRSVGERVIRKMYHQYRDQFPDSDHAVLHDMKLPAAILCDLDGTLADISHRNPYDTAKCLDDTVRWSVLTSLMGMHRAAMFPVKTFFFSGREDKYADLTAQWLATNVPQEIMEYSELVMRPSGDFRPDEVIKRELLDTHVRGKYRVKAVIDDRPRVVRMWRDLGLNVMDVGAGVEF